MLLKAKSIFCAWQDLFQSKQIYLTVEWHKTRPVHLSRGGLATYFIVINFLKILCFLLYPLYFNVDNILYISQVAIQCYTKAMLGWHIIKLNCRKQRISSMLSQKGRNKGLKNAQGSIVLHVVVSHWSKVLGPLCFSHTDKSL